MERRTQAKVVSGSDEELSQSKFADFVGTSRKTVTLWKQKGYLVLSDKGKVAVEATLAVLKDRGLGPYGKGNDDGVEPETPVTESRAELTPDEIAERLVTAPGFTLLTHGEAERFKENYLAIRQKLLYEREAGSLVNRADVERHFTARWRQERDAWENWPSAVAAGIAAEFGVDQIRMRVVLEDAVRDHLLTRSRQDENADADTRH